VAANPFINKLEEIATKYYKSYCGRANWIQICESLQQAEQEIKDCIWGASDGSGFDMTQYPEMNELMNELLEAAAKHPNVTWKEPLDVARFIEAIKGSLKLSVSVDNGALKYQAVGRASGDGWTTFGNTMLMLSYWEYTFHLANIKDYVLKVKGDDVLFALAKSELDRFKKCVSIVFTDRKDEHQHGLGQICKKINFGNLTELDFLSNEFFLTSQGNYRMTRIPARVIQTMPWSTKVPKNIPVVTQDRIRAELCYSKGKCLKAWADGLPIFGVLADKMIELGREGTHSSFDEHADAARVWYQDRDDYDAYLYYLENRYGISKQEVRQVEREIKRIDRLTGMIELPQLEKFYARVM
jgi:hypothetical protein